MCCGRGTRWLWRSQRRGDVRGSGQCKAGALTGYALHTYACEKSNRFSNWRCVMMESEMMVPASEYNAENFLPADLLSNWIRPLVAEFIGPFALTFLGAGAIMTAYTQ